MLTKGEWMREADASAARAWGEKHSTMMALRHGVIPAGVLIGAVFLGWGAWWLWDHASAALPEPVAEQHAGIPSAFWIAAGILLLVTVIAFRPRRIPTPAHILIVKLGVTALLWLGVIAYGVALATTG